MGEGQPRRREQARPEEVPSDWMTEQQGIERAEMNSPTTFRSRRAEALAQFAEEDPGYNPDVDFFDFGNPGSPRYHSPRLIERITQLNERRRAGAVEVTDNEFLPLKSAAKSFIGCAEGVLQRLINNNPPTDNERRDVILSNGNLAVGYSQEYLLRLKYIYETTVKRQKDGARKAPRIPTAVSREGALAVTASSASTEAALASFEAGSIDDASKLLEHCTELETSLHVALNTATTPADKLAFRAMITSLEQLMNDIKVATDPEAQSLMNRMEVIQAAFDEATHSVVTIKKAAPKPIAPQQPAPGQVVFPASHRRDKSDSSAEADKHLDDLAACDRILDIIATAQMNPAISRRVKLKLPALRFAIDTFRGQLNRGVAIDRNNLFLKISQIERLLEDHDEDNDD